MKGVFIFFCSFFLVITLVSCEDKPEVKPYLLPSNALKLISGDSVKTWKLASRYNGKTRMNMGDCFLHYRQSYTSNGEAFDNNAEAVNCGPSLVASWEITTTEKGNSYIKLTSAQIPELLNIEEDHKFFKILYVSKDSLTLSFSHNQFGKKKTITDYLVQEDLEVPDRDFHW